jgi:hypothetical protein
MAKKSKQDELFEMLRARGLRKRVARSLADAASSANGRTPDVVKNAAADLKALATELEDRAKGGPNKRKTAARKAAATRRKKATERSQAAKKAAKTRARGTSTRAKSTASRGASTRAKSASSRTTGSRRTSRAGSKS